jgi:1,2-dihydroxy-3-keto-5-methylthiopentene dioxygenase
MQANWLESDQPAAEIDADTLRAQGVLYETMATAPTAFQPALDVVKSERGYIEQDEVALRPDTPDLDQICAKFDREHFHDEDEVRFVLEGEGIFDIRSDDDRWMRVLVEKGDFIVVPARRHHRFLLTDSKNIRCVRLFRDTSGWVPHYRE